MKFNYFKKIFLFLGALLLIVALFSFALNPVSAFFSNLNNFLDKFVDNEYTLSLDFNSPYHFTYDVLKVSVNNNGASLINNSEKADIISLNPISIDSDSKIIGFKENSEKSQDSSITYQITSDYQNWYYHDGQDWVKISDCNN